MGDTQIPDWPRGITFEQVWAALMEDRKRNEEIRVQWEEYRKHQKELAEKLQQEAAERQRDAAERQAELQKEAAERQAELQKESAKRQKEAEESKKDFYRRMKEIQKSIGGLSGAVGTMAEGLLVPNLKKKFKKLGFAFEVLSPHRKIFNDDNTIKLEIDALLENVTQAMAVETKLTCKRSDIDDHLNRMEKIRSYANSRGDKRPYYGAIASPGQSLLLLLMKTQNAMRCKTVCMS